MKKYCFSNIAWHLYCNYIVDTAGYSTNTMKIKLVRIGNSQGVRIPKPVIEEVGLSDEIEMILGESQIILRPSKESRNGWDYSFEKMAQNQDDFLLDEEAIEKPGEWDESEWTW